MTDHRLRVHESVFAKLVAIMATMAVCLLVLVSVFWAVVTREIHPLMSREVREAAHYGLLVLVLFVIVAVVLAAHLVLRQLLRPLRILNDGVARLGGGELDVRLLRTTRDEFGQLTDTFNQMAGRVRDMIVARDRLLTDVSHELRSPLTRIKVTLELLPEDAQRARLAEDVVEMEHMVTELLELERIRMPRGIKTAREDLTPILREVAAKSRDTHPGVVVTVPEREILVDIDGEKVRTVLRNLLDNAMRYSVPDSRPIEVSAAQTDDAVVVRITDDGVGIPESEAARVFEPFYRVDRSRSKSTGGYGLGLSICKRVMEAHGGTIGVERSAGRGACFVLRFPRMPTGRYVDVHSALAIPTGWTVR